MVLSTTAKIERAQGVRTHNGQRVQLHTPRQAPVGPCYWCGEMMYKGFKNKPYSVTRDHLVPRSLGGAGGTIVLACRSCNSRRGSDTTWVPWWFKPGLTPTHEASKPARFALLKRDG